MVNLIDARKAIQQRIDELRPVADQLADIVPLGPNNPGRVLSMDELIKYSNAALEIMKLVNELLSLR
jgi:hypothetical protein